MGLPGDKATLFLMYSVSYYVQTYVLPLHLGSAAKPVLWDFFKKYPNAESARQADRRELATMLNPLGLHEKRAQIIIRFSGNNNDYFIGLLEQTV